MIAVDASFALKLFLNEPDSLQARGQWQQWEQTGETILVPPLFCLFLPLALIFRGLWLWPLAFYALAVAVQTCFLRSASGKRMARVAPLIVLTHLLYGAGFWKGLFTRLTPPTAERANAVTLERVPVL